MNKTTPMEIMTDLLTKKHFGSNGCVMVTGNAATTAPSGTYYAVQFIANCTPTTLTITNSTTVVGVPHKAGTIIYGDITAITGAATDTYLLYKV